MSSVHGLEAKGELKSKPTEGVIHSQPHTNDMYCKDTGTLHFVPRACLVDLDPGITGPAMGALFSHDIMHLGASSAGNNSAGRGPLHRGRRAHRRGGEHPARTHGNLNSNILIEHIVCRDFETHDIQLNGFDNGGREP